ncbi:hypothetical protein ASPZODRAFT_1702912 [Penicilliopsis zonata CBS 506.65]|uniref:Uncharacterized protein n=1 Tax=Penicilliopsis zonata CBS 506.65 TaxID=1073090 RepID=A0A1L9SJV7_9EURO|nr:hypothetical protein ASPZODRAFT_1702912 [Penicilliopsis zonata CBS 506.65]OJJ47519.1 hypothetical protein ASPZODRAFT_1702912 [Penicilliopsis zonata CBS 506.65]
MTMPVLTINEQSLTFWGDSGLLSPTARTSISPPASPTSSLHDSDEEEAVSSQSEALERSKINDSRTRRSSPSSIRARLPANGPSTIPPSYTNINPYIYRNATHSFTHSWPTHRLIACPRCHLNHGEPHADSSPSSRDLTSNGNWHSHRATLKASSTVPFSIARMIQA